jgi:hypothetical protein
MVRRVCTCDSVHGNVCVHMIPCMGICVHMIPCMGMCVCVHVCECAAVRVRGGTIYVYICMYLCVCVYLCACMCFDMFILIRIL